MPSIYLDVVDQFFLNQTLPYVGSDAFKTCKEDVNPRHFSVQFSQRRKLHGLTEALNHLRSRAQKIFHPWLWIWFFLCKWHKHDYLNNCLMYLYKNLSDISFYIAELYFPFGFVSDKIFSESESEVPLVYLLA